MISENFIDSVWEKAEKVPGYDPDKWRKDLAGAWINKNLYGREGDFGWSIDYLFPLMYGGKEELSNAIPIQWANKNYRHNNGIYPRFKTIITSEKNKNIQKVQDWSIKETKKESWLRRVMKWLGGKM